MKISIENNEIRIKGDVVGEKRHIKISCYTKENKDTYYISIIKDGFEIGCMPILYMDKDFVIKQSSGKKKFVE